MFSKEDILARMHKGESIEDIATAMSNILNEAKETFRKEEEAKADNEKQKLADLQDIIDLIHDFCIEYYCDNDDDINMVHGAFATLDAKSVNKLIEETGVYAAKMTEMQKHLDSIFGTPTVKKVPKKGAPAPKAKTAETIIEDFLSSMGL